MNTQSLKWLSYSERVPGAYDLAFADRLKKFGYAVAPEIMGAAKIDSACIAVRDVVGEKKSPSIIICCPEYRMWEWYSGMLSRLGLEFKFGGNNAITFVSGVMANLIIMGDKTGISFKSEHWDLIIIDAELSDYEIDFGAYKSLGRTEQLVIYTPVLKRYDSADSPFFMLAEYLLEEPPIPIGSRNADPVSVMSYQPFSPVIQRDWSGEEVVLKTIAYSGESESNKKLEALVREVHRIISEPDSCIVIYFKEKQTLDMVYRALKSRFQVPIKKIFGSTVDTAALLGMFNGEKKITPKIILARDDIVSGFGFLPAVTHIFNFDYPEHAYRLSQRFRRRGENFDLSPVFYIFVDKENKADGKILQNRMLSHLYKLYQKNIPGCDILIYAENAADYIARLLLDLKNIRKFKPAKIAEKLSNEYSHFCSASNASEKLEEIITGTLNLFSAADAMGKGETEAALRDKISGSLSKMRGRLAYYNDQMQLCTENGNPPPEDFDVHMIINEFHNSKNYLKRGEIPDTSGLSDCMKAMVLYNLWRGIYGKTQKSYKEFLSENGEG